MIARPFNRPHPIPFAAPSPGATGTRQVSWAASSGPAAQARVNLMAAPAAGIGQGHNGAANHSVLSSRLSPVRIAPAPAAAPKDCPPAPQAKARSGSKGGPPVVELIARFVGQGSLSVRSSVTGRHYRFQGHGDSLVIDKHDQMMLRRIADIVVS